MSKYIKSGSIFTIFLGGRTFSVGPSHINYDAIKSNLASTDDVLENLIDVKKSISAYTGSLVEILDGEILYHGTALHNVITTRILELMNEQLPVEGMVKFLENIMENPSKNAVDQLYTFLEHKSLPIDETGCFLCYKAIQNDWYSKTAGDIVLIQGKVKNGKIYNHPGEVVECVRNNVCDDKNIGCSKGLHVGALEYVKGFGNNDDRYVVCRVNPKDVVSVPSDSSCQKVRACKYEVLCEYTGPLDKPMYEVTSTPVDKDGGWWDDELDVYDEQNDEQDEDTDINVKHIYRANGDTPRPKVTYGVKPSGQKFFNVRGSDGKFAKKS